MDTGTITIILSLLAIIVSIILYIIPQRKKKKEVKEQKKKQLDKNFKYYLGGIYIPMNVKDVQSGGKVFPFFEHFAEIIQKRPIVSSYICLLGDIGSGKTAALTHLHQWYIEKYSAKSSMPKDIRLYTLNNGYQNIMNRIGDEIPLKDRSNCILLLDALDECEEARASLENTQENNPRKFMEQLGKDTEEFAWVVVSCRRQFFQSEEFQPGKAGVPGGGGGFGPLPYWQELILEPFNREQVEKFLVKHFGVGENSKKEEAIKMVYSCEDVFLRPLILSNIDFILEECHGRKNLTMKVILDAVIMNWIKREANEDEVKEKELLNASLCTAAYMYKHKMNYLNDSDYKAMCKEHGIDDKGNLLRVQSLLTNDAKEGFRFAHQSFYEHLLAYWFFLHPEDIDSLLGLLESTLPAYQEILNEYGSNEGKMLQLMDEEKVNVYTIAIGLHNIGLKLDDLCHFSEAEPFYQEALRICRALEEEHPGKFIDDVAQTLNNLAILHYNTNRYDEAEKEYGEALEIRRELAKKNPDAYMPDVAQTLNNLAILHRNTNRYDEAEKEYGKALKIRHELAKKNPDAYMPDVATTLNNLANLHSDTNRNAEAEKEYGEALEIYRELAENNPDAYMPYVATTLNNLAVLHKNTNRYGEAEKEYGEALETYRELAEKNPDAYMPYVATTLINMALLHAVKGELADAEEKAKESLEKFQQMAELSHAAYDKDVENTKNLLALIQVTKES